MQQLLIMVLIWLLSRLPQYKLKTSLEISNKPIKAFKKQNNKYKKGEESFLYGTY